MDLTTNVHTMKPSAFLQSSISDFTLNLNSDYRYLKTGYYVSVHAEVLGNRVIPTSADIIDANRTPILLLKAGKAGIPTLPYVVTSSIQQIIAEIGFPNVTFAVNPFTYDGYKTAENRSALYRAVKSLGMNYKFAVCAMPLKGKMITVKSIFGKCGLNVEVSRVAQRVYEVFKIPLCKLHVQLCEDNAFLCGLQPLKTGEIDSSDIELISEEIACMSGKGERLVG